MSEWVRSNEHDASYAGMWKRGMTSEAEDARQSSQPRWLGLSIKCAAITRTVGDVEGRGSSL